MTYLEALRRVREGRIQWLDHLIKVEEGAT